ncbi:Ribonuclease H-like protein [Dioscorea alata]|uniref:Ribonuclease H-like protein n=1 Tax=Dioscorea alata TaxID=55571 RepID=A0ACB7W1M5_DIOAL|nr:Ribonuclease H-like protein [Dioscorea alata]
MPRKKLEKKVVDLVLDSRFWKECVVIVKVTEPLVHVLRIVNGDHDKPAMGFIYEAIDKAREETRKRFQRRKKRVEPYLKIVDSRWDRQLHKNFHDAGYWLNSRFQYNNQEMENHKHTISGLLDVIERYFNENSDLRSKLTNEMKFFRTAQGDFGRRSAISDRNLMAPGISSFMISSFMVVYFIVYTVYSC